MAPMVEARDIEKDVLSGQAGSPAGGRAGGGAVEFTSTVPARATSIGVVRNAVRGFIDSWRAGGFAPSSFDEERAADLGLVMTELLTNAVLHSGCGPEDLLQVRLVLEDGTIHGSVTDPGRGFGIGAAAPRPRVDGGLGLFIVGRLVRAWGVRRVADGTQTQVWFDF